MNSFWDCPKCGLEAEYSCRCLRADSACKQNHEWHYATKKKPDGGLTQEVHEGPSNHGNGLCCDDPKILKTRELASLKKD